MSSKEIMLSYKTNTPKTAEQILQQRTEARGRGKNYWLALGGTMLSLAGGTVAFEYATAPSPHTVTETVRPFENAYLVAKRAEKEHGQRPDLFNNQQEALDINQKYGDLHVGEKVEVTVK